MLSIMLKLFEPHRQPRHPDHGTTIRCVTTEGDTPMLLWIAIIIAVLWLLGLLANIGGGLIHILLVVAVIVLIIHFVRGRSRV